ncbi:MAG: hypothetical protein H7259_03055, partial [Cytophagales bacterium]|nr:hypothetical protein [Cytophaga sp.]
MNLSYIPNDANYQVSLSSSGSFHDDEVRTLNYEVSIRHLNKDDQWNYIEIRKSNLLMNNEEMQDAFNDVLLQTAEVMNTVVVKMNTSGYAIGIQNHAEIRDKWITIRKKVEDMYYGKELASYLDAMQEKLNSPETLWEALSKSFLYTTFFNGIYKNYGEGKKAQGGMVIRDLLPTEIISTAIDKELKTDTVSGISIISVKEQQNIHVLHPDTQHFFKNEYPTNAFPGKAHLAIVGQYYIKQNSGSIQQINMEALIRLDAFYYKKLQIEILQ